MRIALAADHGGFELKQTLSRGSARRATRSSTSAPHDPIPSDDYPDFVVPLGRAVAAGEVDRGIVICGSGVGASVAANKVKGIRAGLCHDHLFRPPGGRARRHERPLPGRAGHGNRGRLGSRADFRLGDLQRRRATPPTASGARFLTSGG